MRVRDEITNYADEADRACLLWLFSQYHYESQWSFVAYCTFQRYGTRSYKVHRVWHPTPAGLTLYARHLALQSDLCAEYAI